MRRSKILVRALALAMGLGALGAGHVLSASPAHAQDQPQDQPAAPTKDLIFARKIVMDAIGRNMDEIESMLDMPKYELNEGREHADTISVMLLAFPHMFAPASNQFKQEAARDPGRDTYASPDVWKDFSSFYKLAEIAAETAYLASRAKDEMAFRQRSVELRRQCDACHAAFMKKD